ncbi:LysR family transcriptional regulator [Acinetobacter pittii]|uniref:LysR family transcriptional regulator n=1 Tax=Acinetobacter pittii TaxID=48296 RepID=UPI002E78D312|nr:LysR family transcriptional regulator [Acinetobacter pittii]WVH57859.1 LysR family transcriptional regulator [Acinetobacter pittii]
MDIKQLRAFITISETKNITKAASILNIVQPAVSRQIHLLEEELGVLLFERGRHGMQITEEGKILESYARRALKELEQAKMELTSTDSSVLKGTVNIGIVSSLSELLSVALMRVIKSKYPEVNLKISVGYSGHIQDWLVAGDIDLALNYEMPTSNFIDTQPIVRERLWLIGPANSNLNIKEPLEMEAMAELPFILPYTPHRLRTVTEHVFKKQNLALQITVEVNDLNVQKQLIKEGFGYTILPLVSVKSDLQQGGVKAAPINHPDFIRDIAVSLPNTRHISKLVYTIANEISEFSKMAVETRSWLGGEWIGNKNRK